MATEPLFLVGPRLMRSSNEGNMNQMPFLPFLTRPARDSGLNSRATTFSIHTSATFVPSLQRAPWLQQWSRV